MNKYEEYAQLIIMEAYNNSCELSEDQAWSKYGKPNDDIRKGANYLLWMYGEFVSPSLSGANVVYKLSKEGAEFARTNAFKGFEERLIDEKKRNKETRCIAISGLIVAVIVAIVQIYIMLMG